MRVLAICNENLTFKINLPVKTLDEAGQYIASHPYVVDIKGKVVFTHSIISIKEIK